MSSSFELIGAEIEAFPALFAKADADKDGSIGPLDARQFFVSLGLPGPVLGQVWLEANAQQREALSQDDFYVALRLCALAQQQPSAPLSRDAALASKTALVPKTSSAPSAPASPWILSAAQAGPFQQVFAAAQDGGFVTGNKARELFLSYGLPVPDLKVIWQLADADKDERLSNAEFLTAMYLIFRKKQGDVLPQELPQELTASIALLVAQAQSVPPATASASAAAGHVSWTATAEEQDWYSKVFQEADGDHDGMVSSDECRAVFLKSGLERPQLRKVWELVDVRRSDHLNHAEFVAGMHLIACALKGAALPDTLPAEFGLSSHVAPVVAAAPVPAASPAVGRIPSSSGAGARASPAPGGLVGAVREAQLAAAAAQGEAATLREQLAAAQHSLAATRRALSENEVQFEQLRSTVQQDKALAADLAALAAQLAATAAQQQSQLAALASELAETRATTKRLQSEAAAHAEALAEAQRSVQETQKELSQLRTGVVAAAGSVSATAGGALKMLNNNPFADF